MIDISLKDRDILRELAARKAALANCSRNDEILAMWQKQAKGLLLFSSNRNDPQTVSPSRLRQNLRRI